MPVLNPILTTHSRKRVHKRFGIPMRDVQSWIVRKLNEAEYIGRDRDAKFYRNGGVRFVVKGRLVKSITQIS